MCGSAALKGLNQSLSRTGNTSFRHLYERRSGGENLATVVSPQAYKQQHSCSVWGGLCNTVPQARPTHTQLYGAAKEGSKFRVGQRSRKALGRKPHLGLEKTGTISKAGRRWGRAEPRAHQWSPGLLLNILTHCTALASGKCSAPVSVEPSWRNPWYELCPCDKAAEAWQPSKELPKTQMGDMNSAVGCGMGRNCCDALAQNQRWTPLRGWG